MSTRIPDFIFSLLTTILYTVNFRFQQYRNCSSKEATTENRSCCCAIYSNAPMLLYTAALSAVVTTFGARFVIQSTTNERRPLRRVYDCAHGNGAGISHTTFNQGKCSSVRYIYCVHAGLCRKDVSKSAAKLAAIANQVLKYPFLGERDPLQRRMCNFCT